MQLLQYLHFNNSFNKIVRFPSSYVSTTTKPQHHYEPSNYWDEISAPDSARVLREENFNPGDGRYTTHTMGKYGDKQFSFDYLCVWEKDSNNDYTILSRWFITKSTRVRGGQFNLELERDTSADFYQAIVNAPAIIERAKVGLENKLLFNKENFNFNQIKINEVPLQDKTKIPWIVGYIAHNTNNTNASISTDLNDRDDIINVSYSSSALKFNTGYYSYLNIFTYRFRWRTLAPIKHYQTKIDGDGYISDMYGLSTQPYTITLHAPSGANLEEVSNNLLNALVGNNLPSINNKTRALCGTLSESDFNELANISGKIIKTTDNKFFSIDITSVEEEYIQDRYLKPSEEPGITIQSILNSSDVFEESNTMNERSVDVTAYGMKYYVNVSEVKSLTGSAKISSSRNHTNKAMYDIFAIPCGEISIGKYVGGVYTETCKMSKEIAIESATALARTLDANLYDLQLLPYCPIQSLIDIVNGKPCVIYDRGTSAGEGISLDFILTSANDKIGALFYVVDSSYTFNIPLTLGVRTEKRYNVMYPGTTPTQLDSNHSFMIYNGTSMNITGTNIGNDFEGDDWVSVVGLGNGIKVDKVDIYDNSIAETFLAEQINLTLTKIDANTLRVNPVIIQRYDALDIGLSLDTIPDDPYRYVVSFPEGFDYDREEPYHSGNIEDVVTKIFRYMDKIDVRTPESTKIDSETRFVRICSPNYQGSFDFDIAKNNGVSLFNVDITLKPYNPYIHINPDFKNMYGADYDDARGLICNGDFSFGLVKDAWENYELQNKNYESIFNRQIQSMDVEHKIQKQEAMFGLIAGGVSGTVSSAMSGAIASGGNPIGAIAGGVVGGVSSTIGGVLDYQNILKRQTEQRSVAIDMHQFQLDNIKALPYSLTKCPAFTFNNKIFPFIEVYSATEEEIEALYQYLQYRSFNINVVGKIKDYLQDKYTFIQGNLIRLDELVANTSIAEDIYNKIKQGVYIQNEHTTIN